MKPLPHHYEVALSGEPIGYATVSSDGIPPLCSHHPRISMVQAMRGVRNISYSRPS